MTEKKSGKDFVEVLRQLDCPDVNDLQGHDLDWLWETSASHFMTWASTNLTADENLLTPQVGSEADKIFLFLILNQINH
jgi:hypothetical protein